MATLALIGSTGMAAVGIDVASASQRTVEATAQRTIAFRPVRSVSNSILVQASRIMTNRMKALGILRPNVSVRGSEIHVVLVGAKDATSVETAIGSQGNLYFRPVLCGAPSFKSGTDAKLASVAYKIPPTCPAPYRYSTLYFNASTQEFLLPAKYTEDPSYVSYPSTPKGLDNPMKNVILNVGNGGGVAHRYVLGPSEVNGKVVTGTIIKSAYAQLSLPGQWIVIFTLTSNGSVLFNDIAKANYRHLLANDLDGTIFSTPVILVQTFAGSAQISDNFTEKKAKVIAAELSYGPLPVPLIVTSIGSR
jgi:preprotein translocase subunit SecD